MGLAPALHLGLQSTAAKPELRGEKLHSPRNSAALGVQITVGEGEKEGRGYLRLQQKQ